MARYMKCHNAFTGETVDMPSAMTIDQMRRRPTHKGSEGYWIVSDAQLARDLKGRTIKDVYRENKAGREEVSPLRCPPRTRCQPSVSHCKSDPLEVEYHAWCAAKNHTPHPASTDPDHELNRYRERCPPRETVKEEPSMNAKQMIQAVCAKAIAKGAEVVVEKPAAHVSLDYARAVLRRLEETADLEPESLERREAIQAARAIVSQEARS